MFYQTVNPGDKRKEYDSQGNLIQKDYCDVPCAVDGNGVAIWSLSGPYVLYI